MARTKSKITPHTEIIARGILSRPGQVLLCRNKKSNYYYLPGGHIDFAETAAAALAREFLEETGLSVTPGDLLMVSEGIFDQNGTRRHEINLLFHVEHRGSLPDKIPSLEPEIDFEWVDFAAIVETDLRPESTKAWLLSGGSPAGAVWVPA